MSVAPSFRCVKIALIIHELINEGGGERQCVSVARALARLGNEVIVFTSSYSRHCFPEICRELNIHETGRGLFAFLRRPLFVRAYFDMRRLAARVDEPHQVWNPHHWPAQWGALRLKRKLGGAVVWTCNDVPNAYEKAQLRHSLTQWLRSLIYRLYYYYDRAQNQQIDLTVLLSESAEREFTAVYPFRTRVVRSGADTENFNPGGDRQQIRARFGYTEADFVVMWLGIFMPHRRLEDAIASLKLLQDQGYSVKLLLAGTGELFPAYLQSMKNLACDLGVEQHTTFAGKVADSELRDFYCAADAFVFPNEKQTWGLAVLEAMACGTPVLVSTGAAVSEVLADSENAVLFPPRSPEALAAKIRLLLDDPALRRRIAQNAIQLVRNQYTWEQFASRMSEVLCQFAVDSAPFVTR
jgi:glycosyltransferase involved in cell wall biosynthesis